MKKIIIVTGGAGFIGCNLIELLLKKTEYLIFSIDNYSSGTKKIILKIIELNILKLIPLRLKNIENIFKKNNYRFPFW